MAIAYCRDEIIHVASGDAVVAAGYQARLAGRSSVVGLASYSARLSAIDQATGTRFDFRHRADELVHHEVLLPDGAPSAYAEPVALWNAATRKDMTFDRRTKLWRAKRNAQIAIATVLALPKELDLEHQVEIVRRWCRTHYHPAVAIQIDIHDPGGPNLHAHILRSTRKLGAGGFMKKVRPEETPTGAVFRTARGLPKGTIVQGDDWPQRWAEFQNRYFEEHGLPLRVDAVSVVPGEHLGKHASRFDSDKKRENRRRRAEALAAVHDPDEVVEQLARWHPVFDEGDVAAVLRRHKVIGPAQSLLAARVMSHARVAPLYRLNDGERSPWSAARPLEERVDADDRDVGWMVAAARQRVGTEEQVMPIWRERFAALAAAATRLRRRFELIKHANMEARRRKAEKRAADALTDRAALALVDGRPDQRLALDLPKTIAPPEGLCLPADANRAEVQAFRRDLQHMPPAERERWMRATRQAAARSADPGYARAIREIQAAGFPRGAAGGSPTPAVTRPAIRRRDREL